MNLDDVNDRVALLLGRAVIRAESFEVQIRALERELQTLRAERAPTLSADEAAAYTRANGSADESRVSAES